MAGQGSKLDTSKLLLALTEASAFRITPTYVYVYKYKDNNKTQGIVPVRIKHANVPKHWKDIVDPEPGDPLANFVIGTLPKSYDAASDLVLKDKKKSLKDVMTKDGPAGAAAAAAQAVPLKGAEAPPVLLAETPKNLALALGISPDSEVAEFLGAAYDNGGDAAAALEEVIAGKGKKKTTKALESLVAMSAPAVELAETKGYLTITTDDDQNTTFTFNEAVIPKPAVAVAPAAPPPPAPPPAPPIMAAPTPAPAPATSVAGGLPPEDKKNLDLMNAAMQGVTPVPSAESFSSKTGTASFAPSVLITLGLHSAQLSQTGATVDQTALLKAIDDTHDSYPSTGEGLLKRKALSLMALGYSENDVRKAVAATGMGSDKALPFVAGIAKDLKATYTKIASTAAPQPSATSSDEKKLAAFAVGMKGLAPVPSAMLFSAAAGTVSLAPSVQSSIGVHPSQGGGDSAALVAAANATHNNYSPSGDGALKREVVAQLVLGHSAAQMREVLTSYVGMSKDAAEDLVADVLQDFSANYKKQFMAGTAPAATPAPQAQVAAPNSVVAALKTTLANQSPSMPLEYMATTSDGNKVMAASSSLVDAMEVPSGLQGQARVDKMYAAIAKTLEKSPANSPEEAVIKALNSGYATYQITDALKKSGMSPAAATSLVSSVLAELKTAFSTLPVAAQTSMPPAPVPAVPVGGAGGVGALTIPPEQVLVHAGPATSLGGKHQKHFFTAGTTGEKFLFKPSNPAQAAAGAVYSTLATKVLGADSVVPVQSMQKQFGIGTMQPMVPNVKTDLSKLNLTDLNPSQLDTLLRERVADWALSTHDTKAANFIVLDDGKIVGIDKEQAFKHVGTDSLDTTYQPNPTPQVYSQLFDLYKSKKLNLNFSAMLPAIEAVEDIPNEEWMAQAEKYVAELPASQQKKKRTAILARKKAVRKDLEKFITGLMQARGEIGPDDNFVFPKKKKPKKKPAAAAGTVAAGGASAPPMGSVLAPASLPPVESLFDQGPATNIGGFGKKDFLVDANGKKYLLKYATSKKTGGHEPFKVKSQTMFSQVASVVRPGKVVPVMEVPGLYKGKPATLQPWQDLADKPTVGKNTDPATLTDSEKQDIAEEHALDWMLSQHDTHGDNLIRRKDGTIMSIDKEQGFRYLKGVDTDAPDELSIDYKPNTLLHSEEEPYYNKFWRAFSQGKMDFDPTTMLGAIERIEAIPDAQYGELLSDYIKSSPKLSADTAKALVLFNTAMDRKKNIRAEFESFLSKLYQKREGKPGTFTFETGFVGEGEVAPPPKKKKKKMLNVEGSLTTPPPGNVQPVFVMDPTAKGVLGAKNVELVSGGSWTPPPVVKPPTPPGFPEPAEGFQWNVEPAATFFSTAGKLYKTKPPKTPDGQPDPNSDHLVAKFNGVTPERLTEAFAQAGVTLVTPPKVTGSHTLVYMKKEDFEKAANSTASVGIQVPLPPPAPPPTNLMLPIPKAGQLKNPLVETGVTDVDISTAKLGVGQPLLSDGLAVEGQAIMVQRHIDSKGKTFYRYGFKVREGYGIGGAQSIFDTTQATTGQFQHTRVKYNPDTDSMEPTTGETGDTDFFSASVFTSGQSKMWVGNSSQLFRTERNRVYADVYPEEGQDPAEAFKQLLDVAGPKASETVLKTPTPEDQKLMKMSALFWSIAPQLADKLPESERTIPSLMKKLKARGYTEEQIDSIRMEQVGFGYAVPVLPGRLDAIRKGNPTIQYLRHGIDNPNNVAKIIRTGAIGVMSRQNLGIVVSGTSATKDHSPDQRSGGGDSLFTNIKAPGVYKNPWGPIEIVIDPTELERLDAYQGNGGDPFGITHGDKWDKRKPLESDYTTQAPEVCFRQGISPNKILKVRVTNEAARKEILDSLKIAGITEFNGMKVEDFVVIQSDYTTFYNEQLKPAGY